MWAQRRPYALMFVLIRLPVIEIPGLNTIPPPKKKQFEEEFFSTCTGYGRLYIPTYAKHFKPNLTKVTTFLKAESLTSVF